MPVLSGSPEARTPSPSLTRKVSVDTDRVSTEFVDFLKKLPRLGPEIYKKSKTFTDSMASKEVSEAPEGGAVSAKFSRRSSQAQEIISWN